MLEIIFRNLLLCVLCLVVLIVGRVLLYVVAIILIIGAKKIKEELRGGSDNDKD